MSKISLVSSSRINSTRISSCGWLRLLLSASCVSILFAIFSIGLSDIVSWKRAQQNAKLFTTWSFGIFAFSSLLSIQIITISKRHFDFWRLTLYRITYFFHFRLNRNMIPQCADRTHARNCIIIRRNLNFHLDSIQLGRFTEKYLDFSYSPTGYLIDNNWQFVTCRN